MSTIKNPNITQFNGVIEGTPSDQPENTYRPVANVTISEEVTLMGDGIHRIRLYGTTSNFVDINRQAALEEGGLEIRINKLPVFQKRVSGERKLRKSGVMYRPRFIIINDGRIFVEEHL